MAEIIKNDAEWHQNRGKGIGGSEISAIIGKNPYMTNVQLWEYKTGRVKAPDISAKSYVAYGHAAEAPLRELFALDYPEYEVTYGGAWDLVRHPEYPFILATLDGRLIEKETGRKGVLEIKTTEILRSSQKEKWSDAIPENYYCQCLWQMLATGFDFVVMSAQLKRVYGRDIRTETRRYFIERAEVQDDIDYLMQEGIKFWGYVERDEKPPLVLPSIF